MKNSRFTYLILLILFWNLNLFAQETSHEYRIIAVKKGESQITSTSNTAEASPYMTVYIPNAFTPDGDGLNDTFGAKGTYFTEYNLAVYDRWGNMIFQTNDPETEWDGSFKGVAVPEGVYVYDLKAVSASNNIIRKKGSVTVL